MTIAPKKKFIAPNKALFVKPATKTAKKESVPAPAPMIFAKKVVSYEIRFDDGTYLRAEGQLAQVINDYFQECERICASGNLVTYMGPSFILHAADGTVLNQRESLSGPAA